MKKSVFNKVVSLIVVVTMLIAATSTLIGCTLINNVVDGLFGTDGTVSFAQSRLELEVGDTYNLSKLVTADGDCVYASSNERVASLNGATVTAKSVGYATVTVRLKGTSESDTIRIVVADESEMEISYSGKLVQTIGETSAITFTATCGSNTSKSVVWSINGERQSTLKITEQYVFTPSAAGKYEITATSGNATKTVCVYVYYPVTASCTYEGATTQESTPYSNIKFTVTVDNVEQNIEPFVEWKVDGMTVTSGVGLTEYTHSPSAGTHVITVLVNGKVCQIDGLNSVSVICYGAIIPDAPTVVFDNVYPHVYVKYEVEGNVCVKITAPDSSVTEISNTISPELFDENGFDAQNYIELCTTGTQKKYSICVKSLGDGNTLRESDYSDAYTFTQLPYTAQSYLQNTYFDKDHYITSDEEYINLFEYYVIYRTKRANSKVSFDCYVGYTSELSVEDLWTSAFNIGATSGSYTNISYKENRNNVISTQFYVDTVNNPSTQTYSAYNVYSGAYATPLNANLPHINYDEEKYRANDYEFPIDKLTKTQAVTYTDELYLAAENNVKPVPAVGSSAETVYARAKDILRQIVTDDMTDVQKAHAIYDWIMWQVTYDTPATQVSSNGEAYSAYYLEGVFGNGTSAISGVTYYPYAVCDGMSKAYSLMCNIEGIPCVRVSGYAGSSIKNAGGHAWNKVCIGGQWYVVDCTWGDATSGIFLGRTYGTYECALHDWLFVTDSYTDPTHFEPYTYASKNSSWGSCEIRYAPQTAKTAYNVYAEMTYNGTTIDCNVYDSDDAETKFTNIVTQYINVYEPISSVYIPGYGNGNYSITYQALEVKLGDGVSISDSKLTSLATQAVKAVRPSAKVQVVVFDRIAMVLVYDN